MPFIQLDEAVAGRAIAYFVAVATGDQILPINTRMSTSNWTPGTWVVSAAKNGANSATAFSDPTEVDAASKPGLWYVSIPTSFFDSGSGAAVGDKLAIYVDNTGGSEEMVGREIEVEIVAPVDLTTVNTKLDAIKSKTDNLPPDPADQSDIAAALAMIQADTDDIQTRLPAALVSGRMDSTIGDVQSAAAPRVQSAVAIRTVQILAIGANYVEFNLQGQMGDEANETLDANTLIGLTMVLECPSRTIHDGSYPQTRVITAWADLGANLGRATVDRAWDPVPTGIPGPEGPYTATLWPGSGRDVSTDMSAILGLLHQNAMVDNQIYAGTDLASFRLRKFSSAAALAAATPGAADGADGEIFRFIGTVTYMSTGKADMFKIAQVLP